MMDMIIRYRNNMNMLRTTRFGKSRNKFRDAKRAYIRAASGKIELKKATPEQLQEIRSKLRLQKRNNLMVFTAILAVFVPLISFGIYQMISNSQEVNSQTVKAHALLKEAESDKLVAFIFSGDSSFQINDWNSAYYFYFQAYKLIPDDYHINYRLAMAKTYECIYQKKGCLEAEKRLTTLIKFFPDSAELYRLRISKAYALGDTVSAKRDLKILKTFSKSSEEFE